MFFSLPSNYRKLETFLKSYYNEEFNGKNDELQGWTFEPNIDHYEFYRLYIKDQD